ncbi:hypothetical protein EJB05_09759, partial [Eragrostis curvula]
MASFCSLFVYRAYSRRRRRQPTRPRRHPRPPSVVLGFDLNQPPLPANEMLDTSPFLYTYASGGEEFGGADVEEGSPQAFPGNQQ